jgi:hypothetical protein
MQLLFPHRFHQRIQQRQYPPNESSVGAHTDASAAANQKYLPVTAGCSGDLYELFYWDKGEWNSLRQKTGAQVWW